MRVRISKLVSSLLFLLLAAGSFVASPHAEARKVDDTPPAFAGLKSATTCIPGPIGGGRTASYNLAWDAASDDFTPATLIRSSTRDRTSACDPRQARSRSPISASGGDSHHAGSHPQAPTTRCPA